MRPLQPQFYPSAGCSKHHRGFRHIKVCLQLAVDTCCSQSCQDIQINLLKMCQSNVLVIGGGGREHAICWKLAESDRVKSISVSPGNSGMLTVPKVALVPLNIKNNQEVVDYCKSHRVDLVVVGPEDYLANGLADDLEKHGIHCFGPGKSAAQIEADKNWAKSFMDRHGIPTARWASFTSAEEAKKYVRESAFAALVVKATGLAAGKGVVVAADTDEACDAIDEMLTNKKFGAAGETIVIEELLEGEEVSMLVFTDGHTFKAMPAAQDHKRIFDGDLGANTGGMGAYAPCHLISPSDYELAEKNIIERAITGFKKDGIHYVGVLYAGLMLTNTGPKTLEFNCRFGDPETQVILPLLHSDLYEIMQACCAGRLKDMEINWHAEKFSAGVVLASRGYPATSSKGQVIRGLEPLLLQDNCIIFHSGTVRESSEYLTNGGRVLMVTYLAPSLELAAAQATMAAKNISFEGKQFRSDIAHKGIAASILAGGKLSYKSSGVDIQAGDSLVSTIKPLVASTKRSGVLGAIGGFGGLFDTKAAGYKDPILVSGTDGVGTKLKIAISCGKHDTVGIDLVAMCVNDVLAHGAEPLFFLDYFACGRLDVGIASEVISGIVEGCKRAACALIGGETAEMPDMYQDGEYDLAGFAVGAVERLDLLPRSSEIKSGDVVIGLPSSGIHSNGFSLVRKILKLASKSFSDVAPFSTTGRTIGDELLVPTKIYTKAVIPVLKSHLATAFAHITGGGLTENIPRVLPQGLGVVLNADTWKIHPVFAWLAAAGGVSQPEMLRTFNCGIGAILICSPAKQNDILSVLKDEGAAVIGHVQQQELGQPRVVVEHFKKSIEREMRQYVPTLVQRLMKPTKRVGVLISGSGTNLQALIDATNDSSQCIGAEIVLVISNKSSAGGLARAAKAGIPTKVILHNDYPNREEFDRDMDAALSEKGVDFVCLAGFMRILSKYFVQKWRGRIINIHPALLPSFKGANAHKDALAMGVRVSGCTVHFVDVEIDSGAIIEQAAVPVLPGDTVETLQERVKHAEHQIYPKALQHLATGRIQLRDDNTLQWNY